MIPLANSATRLPGSNQSGLSMRLARVALADTPNKPLWREMDSANFKLARSRVPQAIHRPMKISKKIPPRCECSNANHLHRVPEANCGRPMVLPSAAK